MCHHIHLKLLQLVFRSVKSKKKKKWACGEERGAVWFPVKLVRWGGIKVRISKNLNRVTKNTKEIQ